MLLSKLLAVSNQGDTWSVGVVRYRKLAALRAPDENALADFDYALLLAIVQLKPPVVECHSIINILGEK